MRRLLALGVTGLISCNAEAPERKAAALEPKVASSFAVVKRGIVGIYHNVSRDYLHRYLGQFDFIWNHRTLNDGERIVKAIKSAEGKRLRYRMPA